MKDPRINKLADVLVNFSCKVQSGEKVWIDLKGIDNLLGEALADAVFAAGGLPYIRVTDNKIQRRLMMGYTKEQLDWLGETDAALMAQCACYIGVVVDRHRRPALPQLDGDPLSDPGARACHDGSLAGE